MMRGLMIYDNQSDAWTVEGNGLEYKMFCGEIFKMVIGKRKIPCRLELGMDWFIIMDEETKFNLRATNVYQVYI